LFIIIIVDIFIMFRIVTSDRILITVHPNITVIIIIISDNY